MKRPMTLISRRFSYPLFAAAAMACAAINVGQAADNPLRTKSTQSDFQPPAFNIQAGFAEGSVPSLFDAGNFGGQFRVRYEETQELGSIKFSAAASPGSFEPASIESNKELIGASHWPNFYGMFAATQMRYDTQNLWLAD